MKMLTAIMRGGTNLLSWVGKLVLAGMMFFITASVLMRYVFRKPIPGTIDVVMVMMVVVIMVGLAYTQATEGHVSVTLLVDRVSPRMRRIIEIFNSIVMSGVLLLLSWKSFEYSMYSYRIMDSSDMLEIPFYPFKFIMGIGFLFWALEVVLKLSGLFSKLNRASRNSED